MTPPRPPLPVVVLAGSLALAALVVVLYAALRRDRLHPSSTGLPPGSDSAVVCTKADTTIQLLPPRVDGARYGVRWIRCREFVLRFGPRPH